MSTPHIEHFVDERGNFIYRAEFEGLFLSKDEAKALGKHVSGILGENAKLRELVADMCKAFIHGPCYRWCEHMPEPCNGDECQYVRRMRELGVDV